MKILTDLSAALKLWPVWLYMARQDVRSRFRRSFLGPLWLLVNTAFFVAGAGVFYGLMLDQPLAEFIPFLTVGIVIWTFILSTFVEAGQTFLIAEGYIKQFCYPKQVYVLRSLAVYAFILSISLVVIAPVQIAFGGFSPAGWVAALPGLALLLVAAFLHVWISAYMGTRFRDFPHLCSSILQVLFFVTPIMFPAKVLQERNIAVFYQVNPLHYLIDVVRHPILTGDLAELESYRAVGVYLGLLCAIAWAVARRLDARVVFLL